MVESRIREVRKTLGLTQLQVQDLLGIPTRTQQGWESGSRAPSDWLEAMVVREYERIAKEKSQGK